MGSIQRGGGILLFAKVRQYSLLVINERNPNEIQMNEEILCSFWAYNLSSVLKSYTIFSCSAPSGWKLYSNLDSIIIIIFVIDLCEHFEILILIDLVCFWYFQKKAIRFDFLSFLSLTFVHSSIPKWLSSFKCLFSRENKVL